MEWRFKISKTVTSWFGWLFTPCALFTCSLRQTQLDPKSPLPSNLLPIDLRDQILKQEPAHCKISLGIYQSEASALRWITVRRPPCKGSDNPLSDSPSSPAKFWSWSCRESNSRWSWMKFSILSKNLTPHLYLTMVLLSMLPVLNIWLFKAHDSWTKWCTW